MNLHISLVDWFFKKHAALKFVGSSKMWITGLLFRDVVSVIVWWLNCRSSIKIVVLTRLCAVEFVLKGLQSSDILKSFCKDVVIQSSRVFSLQSLICSYNRLVSESSMNCGKLLLRVHGIWYGIGRRSSFVMSAFLSVHRRGESDLLD